MSNQPIKNQEYSFYIFLVSQSTGQFQSNPTIAAGDFKRSIDGAAYANFTNLPVVDPAGSKSVKITFAAAEMNSSNLTWLASDAAGAEWDEVGGNIQPVSWLDTSDRVDVGKVAGTTQTAGDIIADTNDIQSRLPAALSGDGFMKADLKSIDDETTDGNNATLNLKMLTIINPDDKAINVVSNADAAVLFSGGVGSPGLRIDGGVSGNGMEIYGGTDGGYGLYVAGTTDFDAALFLGNGAGGGATFQGGNTDGPGISFTGIGTGKSINAQQDIAVSDGNLTLAAITDAVWDEATSGHTTTGTTGKALTDAGSAGDPWGTALPGAYGTGTAGKIVGDNLNATVSSRASQAVDVNRILDRVDYQRGHHTVTGNTYYVDGVGGNDTTGTGTRAAPYKTISKALTVCTSNNHDEIILLPNSSGGPTTITETATISVTKNYVQIRGPGRDALVTVTAGANKDVFSITANGVGMSGFRIATNGASSNGVTVSSAADFVLLSRLWIENASQDAVQFNVANRCEVSDCVIVASGRDGVRVASGAGSGTYNLILRNVIRDSVGSAVNLQGSDASDCRIQHNVIRDNAVGVTIAAGVTDTVLTDNRFVNNTSEISDGGTRTLQQWNYLSTDTNGRVDVIKVAGTTQTAGDIIADTNDIQSRLPAALSGDGFIKADLKSIDDELTNGNNATLNLKQLNMVNNSGDAFRAESTGGNGAGAFFTGDGGGILATSGLSSGLYAEGGDGYPGIEAYGSGMGGAGAYIHSFNGKSIDASQDIAVSDGDLTLTNIAKKVLTLDWTTVTGEAARSVLNALRKLRNKVSFNGTDTLTVTKEDDTTTAYTQPVVEDENQDPFKSVG